jgi:hypothetical protein
MSIYQELKSGLKEVGLKIDKLGTDAVSRKNDTVAQIQVQIFLLAKFFN